MWQRLFKLLKLNDSIIVPIFDYGILALGMTIKYKIKVQLLLSFPAVIMKLGLEIT